MKVKELSFGTINIDGKEYFKDIVIHKGKKKGVKLVLMSTPDAILNVNEKDTSLILHLAC